MREMSIRTPCVVGLNVIVTVILTLIHLINCSQSGNGAGQQPIGQVWQGQAGREHHPQHQYQQPQYNPVQNQQAPPNSQHPPEGSQHYTQDQSLQYSSQGQAQYYEYTPQQRQHDQWQHGGDQVQHEGVRSKMNGAFPPWVGSQEQGHTQHQAQQYQQPPPPYYENYNSYPAQTAQQPAHYPSEPQASYYPQQQQPSDVQASYQQYTQPPPPQMPIQQPYHHLETPPNAHSGGAQSQSPLPPAPPPPFQPPPPSGPTPGEKAWTAIPPPNPPAPWSEAPASPERQRSPEVEAPMVQPASPLPLISQETAGSAAGLVDSTASEVEHALQAINPGTQQADTAEGLGFQPAALGPQEEPAPPASQTKGDISAEVQSASLVELQASDRGEKTGEEEKALEELDISAAASRDEHNLATSFEKQKASGDGEELEEEAAAAAVSNALENAELKLEKDGGISGNEDVDLLFEDKKKSGGPEREAEQGATTATAPAEPGATQKIGSAEPKGSVPRRAPGVPRPGHLLDSQEAEEDAAGVGEGKGGVGGVPEEIFSLLKGIMAQQKDFTEEDLRLALEEFTVDELRLALEDLLTVEQLTAEQLAEVKRFFVSTGGGGAAGSPFFHALVESQRARTAAPPARAAGEERRPGPGPGPGPGPSRWAQAPRAPGDGAAARPRQGAGDVPVPTAEWGQGIRQERSPPPYREGVEHAHLPPYPSGSEVEARWDFAVRQEDKEEATPRPDSRGAGAPPEWKSEAVPRLLPRSERDDDEYWGNGDRYNSAANYWDGVLDEVRERVMGEYNAPMQRQVQQMYPQMHNGAYPPPDVTMQQQPQHMYSQMHHGAYQPPDVAMQRQAQMPYGAYPPPADAAIQAEQDAVQRQAQRWYSQMQAQRWYFQETTEYHLQDNN